MAYLEERRWKGIPRCAHCKNTSVTKFSRGARAGFTWQCNACRKQFSVLVGTMFHKTRIPLITWFQAIWLFCGHKKAISSLQLANFMELPQRTTWYMENRIRLAMAEQDVMFGPDDVVEVDESAFGAAEMNKHVDKKTPNTQGRSAKTKDWVFGMKSRRGVLKTFVIPKTDKKTLQDIINRHIAQGATIYTDMHRGYSGLDEKYHHETVNHSAGEHVRGDVHVNSIENEWSGMKRIINATYHQISSKHRHRYLSEYDRRCNTRKLTTEEKFIQTLERMEVRLSFEDLISDVPQQSVAEEVKENV